MAYDSDKDLNIVVYSKHIMEPFKKKYPNTYQLMQYNMIGTLELLKKAKVLSTDRISETTAADNNGTCGYRTWQEYKEKIEENLGKINGLSDWRMTKAVSKISQFIYDKYYIRYPSWPAAYSTQSDYVYITCSDTHEAIKGDQKYQVTWSCEGGVTVTDETIRNYERFTCKINGQPTFKILYFDLVSLKQIECDFKNKFTKSQLEKTVDSYYNKTKKLEKVSSALDSLILK